MNADIEEGIVAVVQAAMPAVHVRESISAKPCPQDVQMVIVECPECNHVAGLLYTATIRLVLATPSFNAGDSDHRSASALLVNALRDVSAAKTTFDAAVPSLDLSGIFVRSMSGDIADNFWRSTLEAVVGITAVDTGD